jgi:Beta-lactamase
VTAIGAGSRGAGRGRATADVGRLDLDASVGQILNRWPSVGLAAGVVRRGRLAAFHGQGLADIASKAPVTEDTVYRIASITKTFTAVAVMQLWERGLIDVSGLGLGTARLLFSREPGAGVTALHADFGALSFRRATSPRRCSR